MKHISINRGKRLRDDSGTGHNRWHPDIEPIAELRPGERVAIETRDAMDGQIRFAMTTEESADIEVGVAHPLTGPFFVQGAKPGDLLEVRYIDIVPERYGWTRFRPGAGFLRDFFPEPYLVHWEAVDGWATSPQIPGVRIPEGAFMGTAGVAPSHEQLVEWSRREEAVRSRGGIALPPDANGAVPSDPRIAAQALRTMPPRENCGNADVKQLTKGSRLYIPVGVEGALFSVGDAHYAQGDSECCVTAIEMGATVVVEFAVHEQEARRRNIRFPRFAHPGYFASPEWAAPRDFVATMGMPIRDDGSNESEDLTLAARNALLEMIQLLQERGFTREQAYVICSVAVDLRISNAVDLPNVTVSAFLPEAIFR